MDEVFRLNEARRMFKAARYQEARQLLSFMFENRAIREQAFLLGTRLDTRDNPRAAVIQLVSVEFGTKALKAEASLVLANAYFHTNQASLGDAALARAERSLRALPNEEKVELQNELAFLQCLSSWMSQKFDTTLPEKLGLLRNENKYWRWRGYHIQGWLYSGAGQYEKAARAFQTAALGFASEPDQDTYWLAVTLWPLAVLALDLGDEQAYNATLGLSSNVTWTPHLSIPRTQILRHLAYVKHLKGDSDASLGLLREAEEVCDSPAWLTFIHLDRSRIAQDINEPRWSSDELNRAHQKAQVLEWDSFKGEERLALLMMASRFSTEDMKLASTYLTTYRTLGRSINSRVVSATDQRLLALESYYTANVQRSLNETPLARSLYETAWTIYKACGYRVRAAWSAFHRAEIATDRDRAKWLAEARELIAVYPDCWLARRLNVTENESWAGCVKAYESLTPALKEIFHDLVQGKKPEDIANRRDRALGTVRKQIEAIRSAFKAKTVTDVLVLARQAGLSTPLL